jgi:integrase
MLDYLPEERAPMPKIAKELSALAVSRLSEPGLHAVGVIAGLHLQVQASTARSWVLRAVVGGKRRDIGLGAYPGVTLAQARDKARSGRELIQQGIDPVEHSRAAKSALKAAQAKAVTFRQVAVAYIDAHEAGWKNDKHGQQWRNTLDTYAYPVMGDLLVRDVEKEHVLEVLRPIWTEKNETASRLRSRMELVLSYAMQAGYRPEGLNPARWKGGLDKLLPKPSKVARVENHPALPAALAAAFVSEQHEAQGLGAWALQLAILTATRSGEVRGATWGEMQFAILTATRSGEVRGATWGEIDLTGKVWTIPADRMKARREHRVPLSSAAVKLLKALPRFEAEAGQPEYLFPAARGGQLSDMTLSAVVRRMNSRTRKPHWVDAQGRPVVPHGFRSTFRDWVAEHTSYPNEVAEMALAHTIGNKAEAAYRRGDLFEKRRRLMDEWAAFLSKPMTAGKVIPIKRKA